jgi:hypothetical protein
MKHILFTFLLFTSFFSFSQKNRSAEMGQTSIEELQMTTYEKDSLAHAVVLFEQANYYRNPRKNYRFTTDYYNRIKIFDKDKFQDKATISVYTYKDQSVSDIKATTYYLDGGKIKTVSLTKDQIFDIEETEKYNKTTFTLPGITSGAIVEYSYSVTTPYLGIRDWTFQSDIPKVRSEFLLAIEGNYQYNIRLVGFLPLQTNENSVSNSCFELPNGNMAACAIYSYGMNNVPAFEEEQHMLSKKNYLSKISFDLKSITTMTQTGNGYTSSVKKKVENVTETWKDADNSLKNNFLNHQTKKKNFFKKQLPENILAETDPLKKATSIYNFIRDHYTWNQLNWISSDIDVKESFDQRSGSVDAINLSLYNALQAAEIESYITLVSTRENGTPTKLFPVLNDFNYLIVKAVIGEEEFYLDATNKYRPFGEIPFKCLNGDARVFDFDKGSYWANLNKAKRAERKISAEIQFNEENNIETNLNITHTRYFANDIRNEYYNYGKDEYLTNVESSVENGEIEDYTVEHIDEFEQPVVETFTLIGDDDFSGSVVTVRPITYRTVGSNPFKLKERLYPVDFGYKRSTMQRINFNVPEGYKVTKLPEEVGVKLPNNGGSYMFKVQHIDDLVKIYVRYQIAKKVFTSDEYFYLKEFFNKIIMAENDFIRLEKIQ